MATQVEKLVKRDTEADDFFAELSAKQSPAGREHSGSCLFLAIYFGLIYAVFVLFFWQLGTMTHQTNRGLVDLYQARSLTEIRDALAAQFGSGASWQLPSADSLGSSVDQLKQNITESVQEKIATETDTLVEEQSAALKEQLPANQ